MVIARVYVTPKKGVLDPQGKAVLQALQALGYADVEEVRMGKFMELRLGELPEAEARSRVTEMCEKLLANPLIEDYRIELERAR